ncbi:5197_t:CDS:1, partial [Entrophospora sp. SA101]
RQIISDDASTQKSTPFLPKIPQQQQILDEQQQNYYCDENSVQQL